MKYELVNADHVIKRICKEHDITYGQFAIRLNMSKSSVTKWLYEGRKPPLSAILLICDRFNIDIGEFIKPIGD